MHGVSRAAWKSRTEEELAKRAAKAKQYKALEAALQDVRRRGDNSDAAVDLGAQLLRVNPDAYSAWNHRREMLFARTTAAAGETEGGGAGGAWELAADVAAGELRLTAEALRRQPKSYPAWHHRRWVLERLAGDRETAFAEELRLCAVFLDADERNFHCWNHRRWAAAVAGVTPEENLAYTQDRLDVNFSNYSAFHERSQVLPRLEAYREDPLAVLAEELMLVQNITVTEPEDQSAWWYYRFLLAALLQVEAEDGVKLTALRGEQQNLRDLLELETDCKWALVMLAHIHTHTAGLENAEAATAERARAAEIYGTLVDIDADHKLFYESRLRALEAARGRSPQPQP
mmetsp:Transcript_21422/g.65438  ORF Transcript_21422/g.65438 Transcript_21422/m.65438 type:complete len:345 (-) Transcript_21422:44-1078(-)